MNKPVKIKYKSNRLFGDIIAFLLIALFYVGIYYILTHDTFPRRPLHTKAKFGVLILAIAKSIICFLKQIFRTPHLIEFLLFIGEISFIFAILVRLWELIIKPTAVLISYNGIWIRYHGFIPWHDIKSISFETLKIPYYIFHHKANYLPFPKITINDKTHIIKNATLIGKLRLLFAPKSPIINLTALSIDNDTFVCHIRTFIKGNKTLNKKRLLYK